MTKDDYLLWRNDPRTEEYLTDVLSEMNNHMADIITTAGMNSLTDRYRVGVIRGLQFLTEWQPNFDREENLEDES